MKTLTLSERLREETARHHEDAENNPLEKSLFGGTLPRAGYIALLGQRFRIHHRLEFLLHELAAADARVRPLVREELLQTPRLGRDLIFFGRDPERERPTVETARFLSDLDGLAQRQPLALLGPLYVFEGSKNGGRMIARQVAEAYDLTPGPGLLYLDPHGNEQRTRWKEWKASLDELALSQADNDAIVAAAQRTFEAVREIEDALHRQTG